MKEKIYEMRDEFSVYQKTLKIPPKLEAKVENAKEKYDNSIRDETIKLLKTLYVELFLISTESMQKSGMVGILIILRNLFFLI